MYSIHRNKISMKDNAEDTVIDFDETIRNFLLEYNPEKWRQAMDCLQKAFASRSETILEIMFDEIGWN